MPVSTATTIPTTRSSTRVKPAWRRATDLGTAFLRALDPRPAAIRKHDLHSVVTRSAQAQRAHLQRAAQHPRMTEGSEGDVAGDRLVAANGNCALRRTLDVQDRLARVHLAVLISIDEHDPALLPSGILVAARGVAGLAERDAKAA